MTKKRILANQNLINKLNTSTTVVSVFISLFLFALGIAGGHGQLNNIILQAVALLVSSITSYALYNKESSVINAITYLAFSISIVLMVLILTKMFALGPSGKQLALTMVKVLLISAICGYGFLIVIKLKKRFW